MTDTKQLLQDAARAAGPIDGAWSIDCGVCMDGDEFACLTTPDGNAGEYVYKSKQPIVFAYMQSAAIGRGE